MQTIEDLLAYAASLQESADFGEVELRKTVEAFAAVQPPEDDFLMHYIVLSPGGTGTSRKPGNIRLSWGNFFDTSIDVSVASIGVASQNNFARALIGLYIWNKVWRGTEIQLGDPEASVIEAIWRSTPRSRHVSSTDAFAFTNELRQTRSVPELSRRDFEVAVNILTKMSCVKLKEDTIWLREWVRKQT